jgi:hypothetical protein
MVEAQPKNNWLRLNKKQKKIEAQPKQYCCFSTGKLQTYYMLKLNQNKAQQNKIVETQQITVFLRNHITYHF